MSQVIPFGSERDRDILRTPPANAEAERALLGAIMLNNRSYDKVCDLVQPEHFADPANARIYMACAKLLDGGHQANPVTLKTHLERDELVIAAGGMKYLAGLANTVVTIVNVADYGRIIYDLFVRRELINIGEEIASRAYGGDMDDGAPKQLDAAASQIADLMGTETRSSAITLFKAAHEVCERWQAHDNGTISGISSGLLDLDSELGLLEGGDMIVLAGPPASGKTALATTIAYNAAKYFRDVAGEGRAKRALIFSSEMKYRELASRAMTTYTGIQGPRRRKMPLLSQDWDVITRWIADTHDLPLIIDDRGAPTLAHVNARCRQEERKGGIGLVVLDYLQIMGDDRAGRDNNRADQVARLAMGMKIIAGRFNCPVILISSINRKNEDRDDKRPHMSDLRSSGEIEFAADAIAFCHREEYYLERNEPDPTAKEHGLWEMKMDKCRNIAEVIVAKSRHGSSGGVARLHFDRTRTLFSDLARDEPPMSDSWKLL